MNFNQRVVVIETVEQAHGELKKINCDMSGVNIMQDKAVFKVVKLENISTKAANLLKQTFLAKGGEVAVARGTADLSVPATDVLVCATLKQYKLALAQLKLQPWGLPVIAGAIEEALIKHHSFPCRRYQVRGKEIVIVPNHTLVMGILNITPDSFPDGGKYNRLDAALKHAEEMIRDGADLIDIGAESTRPYGDSKPISTQEEIERLLPFLEKVLAISDVPVSIDTYHSETAEEALKLGAHMINDVWGLQYDNHMAKVVAKYKVPLIIMHNQSDNYYEKDIMSNISTFLQRSKEIGINAGIDPDYFIIDPGIGFAKNLEQNLEVLSRLEEFKSMGCPILLGTSRKKNIGDILNLPVEQRAEGTGATVALGITKGVNIVRAHDVKVISRITKMMDAMKRSGKYNG